MAHCGKCQTRTILMLGLLFVSALVFAQKKESDDKSNDALLNQYVKSKGNSLIVFDSSNIKQFWVDNSVVSKDNSINILLRKSNQQGFDSIPLRIQLANVWNSQDCKVEVISETADLDFSTLNGKQKDLSVSSPDDKFINYSVNSSVFHLEDVPEKAFFLKFSTKKSSVLSIKRIVLTFPNNANFLSSPGVLKGTIENLSTASTVRNMDDMASVTGKRTVLNTNKNIIVSNNTSVQSSAKIKNIGETQARLFIGYTLFSRDSVKLDSKNYPYDNTIIKVVSSEENSKTIIVDSMPSKWTKGCYIALNAEEDLSDIPNMTLSEGKIQEIKELPDGHAEITLDKPFKNALKENTKLRIHGSGGNFFYTTNILLNPGQEESFKSFIPKDESMTQYSYKVFPKGVYYVQPSILSYSQDSNTDNTILIIEFDHTF